MMQGALENSEVCLRAMSDAFPLGVFVSDSQGGCVYINAACQKISGLMFEQTLGTNWGMAIHPEDRQRVLTEWRQATTDQAAIPDGVSAFSGKEGVWCGRGSTVPHRIGGCELQVSVSIGIS